MQRVGIDRGVFTSNAARAPVVLFGASYIAAWPLAEVADRPVVNRGIPGNQTHELLERFEADVVALQPCAVVIWGIDNDIIRAPAGRTLEACQRVERNLEALVQRARAHGIEPVLVTDMTLRGPSRWYEGLAAFAGRLRGKQGYQEHINGHILQVNDAIRALAARTGARLLDLNPLLAGPDGKRDRAYAKDDGSHLTATAYRVIDDYAKPRLAAWLDELDAAPVAVPRVRVAGMAAGGR